MGREHNGRQNKLKARGWITLSSVKRKKMPAPWKHGSLRRTMYSKARRKATTRGREREKREKKDAAYGIYRN